MGIKGNAGAFWWIKKKKTQRNQILLTFPKQESDEGCTRKRFGIIVGTTLLSCLPFFLPLQ
jgi:hypothetical protein